MSGIATKIKKSYGFAIYFGGKTIQQINKTEDIIKFIENAMESEIIKGYLNHYVEYNNLNHKVNVTKTAPFEWTCTIYGKQFYVDLNGSVYILNHKERFNSSTVDITRKPHYRHRISPLNAL